jgi:hypothetical protein
LDTLEEHMAEPKPTLDQITHAVWELRQELTGSLAAAVLEQRYRPEREQQRAPCPQCGRRGAARGVVSRTVETVVGAVEVSRPYFYCGSSLSFPVKVRQQTRHFYGIEVR